MVTMLENGTYELVETPKQIQILRLDGREFVWIYAKHIGYILVVTTQPHRAERVLANGHYRLFNVFDEPALSDQLHLELGVGGGRWQGYLLPTGLPTEAKHRSRVIPTHEVISSERAVVAASMAQKVSSGERH